MDSSVSQTPTHSSKRHNTRSSDLPLSTASTPIPKRSRNAVATDIDSYVNAVSSLQPPLPSTNQFSLAAPDTSAICPDIHLPSVAPGAAIPPLQPFYSEHPPSSFPLSEDRVFQSSTSVSTNSFNSQSGQSGITASISEPPPLNPLHPVQHAPTQMVNIPLVTTAPPPPLAENPLNPIEPTTSINPSRVDILSGTNLDLLKLLLSSTARQSEAFSKSSARLFFVSTSIRHDRPGVSYRNFIHLSGDTSLAAFASQSMNAARNLDAFFIDGSGLQRLSPAEFTNFAIFDYGHTSFSLAFLLPNRVLSTFEDLWNAIDIDTRFRILIFGPEYTRLFIWWSKFTIFIKQYLTPIEIAVDYAQLFLAGLQIYEIPNGITLDQHLASIIPLSIDFSSGIGAAIHFRTMQSVVLQNQQRPKAAFPPSYPSHFQATRIPRGYSQPRPTPPRQQSTSQYSQVFNPPPGLDLTPLHRTCVFFLKFGVCERFQRRDCNPSALRPMKHGGLFDKLPPQQQADIRAYFAKNVARHVR
jgi:hypothetical protein